MPDLRFQPSPATLTSIPRPKRGEGQWALGYMEPLNKNEQSKKDDNPLNVRARILNIYSKRGFASIDPADLRGRFRWMGLYTQRAPGLRRRQDRDARGGGAGRQVLHAPGPHRRRAARAPTAAGAGQICIDFARDTADVTDRENIQYHWIRIEDVPEIWRAARRRRADQHRGLRRLAAAVPRLPRRRRRRRRDHRRHPGARGDQAPLHRRPGVLQPAAQVQDRRSAATRATTSRPRSTTSRSSAPCTPSTAPASTCGSAAACRPTRCWRRGSASGSRSTRSPTSGRA